MDRTEYVAVGEPMIEAFEAEHHAEPGDVIISSTAWGKIQDYFKSDVIQDKENSYYRLDTKFKGDVMRKRNKHFGAINLDHCTSVHEKRMRNHIPGAILRSIDSNHPEFEVYSSELRRVSVLFVSLGFTEFDLVEAAQSDREMLRIHYALRITQQGVYKFEGALNKFLMDDKGATLIAVFGLPPYSHENDPVRAVSCSMHLVETLKSELDLDSSVGVTTGVAFCGVLGSQTRKEYSVLGDIVNLSARLMTASKQCAPCLTYCDIATYEATNREIPYTIVGNLKVKGKKHPIPTFQALLGDQTSGDTPQKSLVNVSRLNPRGRRNSPATLSARYATIDLVTSARASLLQEDKNAKNENLRVYFKSPTKLLGTPTGKQLRKSVTAGSATSKKSSSRLSKRLTAMFSRESKVSDGEASSTFSVSGADFDDDTSSVHSLDSPTSLSGRGSGVKRDSFVFYNADALEEHSEADSTKKILSQKQVYMQTAVGTTGLNKVACVQRDKIEHSYELIEYALKQAKRAGLVRQGIPIKDVSFIIQGTEMVLPSSLWTSNADFIKRKPDVEPMGLPLYYIESIVTEALANGEIRSTSIFGDDLAQRSMYGEWPLISKKTPKSSGSTASGMSVSEYCDETGNGGTTLKLVVIPKKDLQCIQSSGSRVMQTLMERKIELIEYGKGSVSVISGDPGAGKTHLLKRFSYGFLPGKVPIYGSVEHWDASCGTSKSHGSGNFGVWYDIILQWLDQEDPTECPDDVIKSMINPSLHQYASFLNDALGTAFPKPSAVSMKSLKAGDRTTITRSLIVDIVSAMTSRAEGGGLILIFDDGLRVDEQSLRVMTKLSSLIGNDELSLMLVFASRSFEGSVDRSLGMMPALLTPHTQQALPAYRGLCAQSVTEFLQLGPMSTYQAYELFRKSLSEREQNVHYISPDLWKICEDRCYNNPRLIKEFGFEIKNARRPRIVTYTKINKKLAKKAGGNLYVASLAVAVQEIDESCFKVHADNTVAASKQAAHTARGGDGDDTTSPEEFTSDYYPPCELQAPATAAGVLGARIDRLPQIEILVLKIAAVIGRTFSLRLVEDVYPFQGHKKNGRENIIKAALENLSNQQGILSKVQGSNYNDEFVYEFSDLLLIATMRNRLLSKQKSALASKLSQSREAFRTLLDCQVTGIGSSTATPGKSGYVQIKKATGRLLASETKERYMELGNDKILIFKKSEDTRKPPHEVIHLNNSVSVVVRSNSFIVTTSDWIHKGESKQTEKEFHFFVASAEEADSWASRINMLINKAKLSALLPTRFGTVSTRSLLSEDRLLPVRKRTNDVEDSLGKDQPALILHLEKAVRSLKMKAAEAVPVEIYASVALKLKSSECSLFIRKQTSSTVPKDMSLLKFGEKFVLPLDVELMDQQYLEICFFSHDLGRAYDDLFLGHASIQLHKLSRKGKTQEFEILNPYSRRKMIIQGSLEVRAKFRNLPKASTITSKGSGRDLASISTTLFENDKTLLLRASTVAS